MEYRPGLNQRERLADRMAVSFEGATALHLGVAYAKSSGVAQLLALDPPRRGRAVVGLGFGVTDPLAVEQLAARGFDVRSSGMVRSPRPSSIPSCTSSKVADG